MLFSAVRRQSSTVVGLRALSTTSARILIVDGYDQNGVDLIAGVGAPPAYDMFKRMLGTEGSGVEGVEMDVVQPAVHPSDLPSDAELATYDGVAWTGSSLTSHDLDNPNVTSQIAFADRCFNVGVPQFGSCWGLQMVASAVGIPCTVNTRGREQAFGGVDSEIELTDIGASHGMFKGHPQRFRALQAHTDHISPEWAARAMATGGSLTTDTYSAQVLSTSGWTPVQALAIQKAGGGEAWAAQYHAEFSLDDMGRLTYNARPIVVGQGVFPSEAAVDEYAELLKALHADPTSSTLRAKLVEIIEAVGGGSGSLTQDQKAAVFALVDNAAGVRAQAANWLTELVIPTKQASTSVPASSSSSSSTTVSTATPSSATDLVSSMGWDLKPYDAALGAELLGVDLSRDALTPDALSAIRAALLEHEVIFFRDQHSFQPEDHVALAAAFGPIQDTHPAYPTVEGFPITILENDRDNPSLIELVHTDMTFRPMPPMGSILHGVIIPDGGRGDTEFYSSSKALDDLPPDVRAAIDGKMAVHDFAWGFKESLAQPGGRERLAQALKDNPPVEHPVIRTHPESGRKGLFVNRLFTTHIVGMEEKESEELLQFLYTHLEDPKYATRFKWQPNSIAFWDNRITAHRPINDYWPAHRKLQRITVDGTDRPF